MVVRAGTLCHVPPAESAAGRPGPFQGLRSRRAVTILVLVALAAGGCNRRSSSSTEPRRGPTANTGSAEDQLILSLADNLNHLEEFEADQILPQIRHRLDQWVEQRKPSVDWQRDALIETLPEPLRGVRALSGLDKEKFTEADMLNLREAVWLRDIARHARGSELDDLSIARQLFDWTVRNLQLDDEAALAGEPTRRFAHEVLQSGRATASERTWIFTLLLRQQGLDAVVLGISDPQTRKIRPWAPALVTDKDLYLFDSELGLPIPGPNGRPVATLAELAADDGLLRKLDLSSQRKYPVEAGQLKDLVAYVEASPSYLARRMKLVETKLTGQNKIVLSAQPQQIAERLSNQPLIAEVRYWPYPFVVQQSRDADQSRKAARLVGRAAAAALHRAAPPGSGAPVQGRVRRRERSQGLLSQVPPLGRQPGQGADEAAGEGPLDSRQTGRQLLAWFDCLRTAGLSRRGRLSGSAVPGTVARRPVDGRRAVQPGAHL